MEILSVFQFNSTLKEILRQIGTFRVKGEITELNITAKKGVFITLADDKATTRISGYAPTIQGMNLIEKGMTVVVQGVCDMYVPYGTFSLTINKVEPAGEGALAMAYQKLKQLLEAEGLFAVDRKLPLPRYITKIALLTGKDSAAYSDFTKILREHKSAIEVDFYPVIVQGESSVASIMQTLKAVKDNDYDAIVLTRGGGSLEDLKSFNDETIVREIFTSRIPFIVGVGHERDESLSDYVAAVRASTPSQCAYYLAKRNQEFVEDLASDVDGMYFYIHKKLMEIKGKLNLADQMLDEKVVKHLAKLKEKLVNMERLLKSYDVTRVLKRGFAIVTKEGQNLLSAEQLAIGDLLTITLHEGKVSSVVEEIIK